MIRVGILTVSDRCAKGLAEDRGGPRLVEAVKSLGWSHADSRIVADEQKAIAGRVKTWVDRDGLDLILATGGTGVGPRDRTPEALRPLLDLELPGFGEVMRARGLKSTPKAILSRSGAGTRKRSLILYLPGSPGWLSSGLKN